MEGRTGDGANFNAIRKVLFCKMACFRVFLSKYDFILSWPLASTCLREIWICYRRNEWRGEEAQGRERLRYLASGIQNRILQQDKNFLSQVSGLKEDF